MKKLLILIFGFVLLLGLGACGGLVVEDDINETLLYGRWQEGSVYQRYYASPFRYILPNGDTVMINGTTWDVSDDVSEDEAQVFIWTRSGKTLTHENVGTFVTVPKVYTINTLSDFDFIYSDEYGTTHHFSRVD